MNEVLVKAFGKLDDDAVMEEVKKMQAAGTNAMDILNDLQEGMQEVGQKYAENQYYLSELIMSAEIFKEAIKAIGGIGQADSGKKYGTMILGTVKGDIHDIGKNIVAAVMGCNGFKIIDLGVDVPIAKFVDAVKENQPDFVGISCLLTTNFDNTRETITQVKAAGFQGKFIIGGGPCDEGTVKYVGADALAKDAQEGIKIAKKMLGVN
ncbi:cobalamin B12-binding domain-containing protein [Candidatus Formimonas warabiya]|uniref:Cobalamin-binding protein n=1 Tax=Formimonas warabiya TaxID=1761012 RepID=A0A3G1KMW2_FORW1|nr:cobalamin-dependent protein [Candidatus Formimonas warabiya]ATW23804.1 cobalamin-binding protein [Candidatus Formimonas warabiya]